MELETVLILALSFLLVIWIVWQIAAPLITRGGEIEERAEDSAAGLAGLRELEQDELEEDFLSGKILPEQFEKISRHT